jgi:hypothetical protein
MERSDRKAEIALNILRIHILSMIQFSDDPEFVERYGKRALEQTDKLEDIHERD